MIESDARFRSMADSAPVLMWMSGTDRGCIFNKARSTSPGAYSSRSWATGWSKAFTIADQKYPARGVRRAGVESIEY